MRAMQILQHAQVGRSLLAGSPETGPRTALPGPESPLSVMRARRRSGRAVWKRTPWAVVAVVAGTGFGCGWVDASTERDAGGSATDRTEILHTAALTPTLRIGNYDDEGPEAFGHVVDVAVGADGRIYIADSQAKEVAVFNRDGTFVESRGGPGEGPGEFRFLSGLALHPNGDLWVMDPLNDRLTGYTQKGMVTAPLAFRVRSATIPWVGRFGSDGSLLDWKVVAGLNWTSTISLVRSFVGDSAASHILTLPADRTEYYSRTTAQIAERAALPFSPGRRSAIAPDGTLWWNDEATYTVHQLGANDDTLRSRTVEELPPSLPYAERDSASQASGVPVSRLPERRQLIENLIVDSENRLWVVLVGVDGGPQRWELWLNDTERVRVVPEVNYTTARMPLIIIGDTVYGVVADDLGRQSIVRSELRIQDGAARR